MVEFYCIIKPCSSKDDSDPKTHPGRFRFIKRLVISGDIQYIHTRHVSYTGILKGHYAYNCNFADFDAPFDNTAARRLSPSIAILSTLDGGILLHYQALW